MFSKTGNTTISGNLTINGDTVELNSDNVNIKNNTILLNSKETSNKISNNVAGLEINRGTSLPYQILYDERDSELKSGLSNNLKQISSEEYTTTNVTNAKTDLNTQIYKSDFMNELPKIGYYQEDTVEVLSKYNMNQFEKFWAMTSTGNGEEVLYFYGSDGSYDANGKLQLFKATRQNQNSTFSFYNEPLQPKFLKGKKYYTEFNTNSYRLYAGNKWLMMSCKLETEPDSIHYYLINTKNSSDPKLWDEYKDISSIISNENIQSINNIGNFRYFPDIGVITIINGVPGGLTNTKDCGFVFSVFRYSDLKLLYQQKLPGVWELVRCDTSQYSFSTTTIESNPKASNTITQTGTVWGGTKSLFFYKSEFLGIFLNNKTCYIRRLSDNRISEEALWLELTYRIPKSLISLNPTGTITCYNTTDDFVFGTNYLYHNNTEMKNVNVVSVDENNSIFNLCSYSSPSDKNPVYFYKIKDTIDQNTEGTNPKLWGRKTYYISPPNFAISPDASLWGKQIYRGVVMWDKVFLSCKSKDGDHLLVVSEFQKYKNNNNIIEPKPGSYFEIDISKNSPFGNGYFIPTSYFGSAKLENGEPCYFYTYYSSTNKQLRTVQLIYSETNKEAPVTIETLNILNLSYTIESLFVNFLQNQSQVGISYNPLGQYYIAFIQDRSNSYLNSTTRKMYFAIIKKDGSYKVFDNTYESKWCSNYSGINNSSNNYSKQGILLTLSTKDFLISDKYHNRIMLEFVRNSDNYGNYIFELVFNESFSDFTMNNLPKISQPHKGYYSQGSANQWKIGEVSVLYNKKYGLVQYGDTWEPPNPMDFYFQKQLIQGTGTDYSFDDYYKSSKYNKYSMYLQSAQGLICYIPNIPIFLGGYFSVIENPIQVILKANSKNYIYLERDPSNRKNIIATSATDLTITEGSRQFSKICVACVTTDDANPINVEYYRINTGYNDYTFYHKITIKQTPNQTIHVYTTENGKEIDHTSSFFVKINSNIQYSIEIKPDLWCAAGTLQNISSSGIIDKNLVISATPAKLISTNYSYNFKMEYASSNNPPIYRFGNNYSATYPDGQNYSGNLTPIDQLGIYTNLDSVIHYQYSKPLPDGIKSVFIKLVCKDGEHFLGHFMRDEFDQYGDVYHSKVLGTQENLNLFKRLYDTKEIFTCVTGIET